MQRFWPSSVSSLVSTKAASFHLSQLPTLDYFHSVSWSNVSRFSRPLKLYVDYFRAEQEGNHAVKELLFCRSRTEADDEESFAVHTIICGRRLLEWNDLTAIAIQEWSTTALRSLPPSLTAYAHFLTGSAYNNIGLFHESDFHLQKSSLEFSRLGASERELLSWVQRPLLTIDDLAYLRKCAEQLGDRKAVHVANSGLAERAVKQGDLDLAKEFATQAHRGFGFDFLDPRRKRKTQELLTHLDVCHALGGERLTPKERLLVERLTRGPASKQDLIIEIYGAQSSYHCPDSIDARFRTLLSRINRKLDRKIIRAGDHFRF